jgi:hypothetical protein
MSREKIDIYIYIYITIHIISNDTINFSFTISKASNNTAIKLFLELVIKFMSDRGETIIIL